MRRVENADQGFTLVELLVAMVIALVAMLAATSLYVGARQTYRLQEMQSRLSEDGRFALSMIQRLVMQSGFRSDPSSGIAAGYLTPVSQTQFTINFTGDGANTVDCDGALTSAAAALTIKSDGNSLKCGTTEWIAPATGGKGTELVDFAVYYGVDSIDNLAPINYGCGSKFDATHAQRDCVADLYTPTGISVEAAIAAMDRIVAVRVCLVLRTEDTDASVIKDALYKNCSDGDITDSKTDKKLYRTFQSTILVRNRGV